MILNNLNFQLIEENAKRIKSLQDQTTASLNIKEFRREIAVLDKEAKKYEKIAKDSTGLEIAHLIIDLKEQENDSTKMERAATWSKKLSKDI